MAKRVKTTTSSDLSGQKPGGNVPDLAVRINRDRVARRLTWPAYADFLGVPMTTIYKIARGLRKRPHQLTVAQIEERMALPIPKR